MGLIISFIMECFPPSPRFSVDDIPDLEGQVAIVTGGNAGVGWETAKALLNHNAKVYIAARSKDKALTAIKELKHETGKEALFLPLDLSDLESVKRAGEEFQRKETQLHMLFNNAGVMAPPVEQVTTQGYDLQFGTNVLGHFYFTKLLLSTLLATAESTTDGRPRIVNTSSLVSRLISTIDFNTLKDGKARVAMGTEALYNQSKLGNIIVSTEFARRYGDQGLVFTAVNPGNLKSSLQRHMGAWKKWFIETFLLHPVPFGALTQLWAGTTKEGATMNGKYLIPWARYGEANPAALDEKLGRDMWEWLEEQVASL